MITSTPVPARTPPSIQNFLLSKIRPRRMGCNDNSVPSLRRNQICSRPPVCECVRAYTYPMRYRCAANNECVQIKSFAKSKVCLPISVKKSKITTGGPISGNIKENVEAKMTASMQAPVENEGLYERGYMAGKGVFSTAQIFQKKKSQSPRKRWRGVTACFSARRICQRRNGCNMRSAGEMIAIVTTIDKARALM
jgi:hypothetical protein